MAKPEWGVKRICHACGTRYYDLERSPILCPSCGVEFDPEAFLKSRRSRPIDTEEAKPAKAKAIPADAAAEGEDEDEDTDVPETTGDDADVIDADIPDTDEDDTPKVKTPDTIDDDSLDEEFDDESGDDALLGDDELSDDDVDLPTENDDEDRNS